MSNESNVELNKYYVNKKIKGHILSEEQMEAVGFRWVECIRSWYYCRSIPGIDISFNVSIYEDNPEEPKIEILDECFCQNYDYQYILERDPKFKVALMVKNFVEKQMKELQKSGVLSGHVYGEYI